MCSFGSERHNCVRRSRAMTRFSDIIQALCLADLPLQGARYTWSSGEEFIPASRIDRFLVSSEWNDTFQKIKQVALPKVISDHSPLMLESGDWDKNPSYFKFENMWLNSDGFLDKIKTWWQSYEVNGSTDFILEPKLKLLKKDLTI